MFLGVLTSIWAFWTGTSALHFAIRLFWSTTCIRYRCNDVAHCYCLLIPVCMNVFYKETTGYEYVMLSVKQGRLRTRANDLVMKKIRCAVVSLGINFSLSLFRRIVSSVVR